MLTFAAIPASANATALIWEGDESTAFGTPGNWDQNLVPDNDDTLTIPNGTPTPVISDSGGYTVISVVIEGGATLSVTQGALSATTVTIDSGGTLQIDNNGNTYVTTYQVAADDALDLAGGGISGAITASDPVTLIFDGTAPGPTGLALNGSNITVNQITDTVWTNGSNLNIGTNTWNLVGTDLGTSNGLAPTIVVALGGVFNHSGTTGGLVTAQVSSTGTIQDQSTGGLGLRFDCLTCSASSILGGFVSANGFTSSIEFGGTDDNDTYFVDAGGLTIAGSGGVTSVSNAVLSMGGNTVTLNSTLNVDGSASINGTGVFNGTGGPLQIDGAQLGANADISVAQNSAMKIIGMTDWINDADLHIQGTLMLNSASLLSSGATPVRLDLQSTGFVTHTGLGNDTLGLEITSVGTITDQSTGTLTIAQSPNAVTNTLGGILSAATDGSLVLGSSGGDDVFNVDSNGLTVNSSPGQISFGNGAQLNLNNETVTLNGDLTFSGSSTRIAGTGLFAGTENLFFDSSRFTAGADVTIGADVIATVVGNSNWDTLFNLTVDGDLVLDGTDVTAEVAGNVPTVTVGSMGTLQHIGAGGGSFGPFVSSSGIIEDNSTNSSGFLFNNTFESISNTLGGTVRTVGAESSIQFESDGNDTYTIGVGGLTVENTDVGYIQFGAPLAMAGETVTINSGNLTLASPDTVVSGTGIFAGSSANNLILDGNDFATGSDITIANGTTARVTTSSDYQNVFDLHLDGRLELNGTSLTATNNGSLPTFHLSGTATLFHDGSLDDAFGPQLDVVDGTIHDASTGGGSLTLLTAGNAASNVFDAAVLQTTGTGVLNIDTSGGDDTFTLSDTLTISGNGISHVGGTLTLANQTISTANASTFTLNGGTLSGGGSLTHSGTGSFSILGGNINPGNGNTLTLDLPVSQTQPFDLPGMGGTLLISNTFTGTHQINDTGGSDTLSVGASGTLTFDVPAIRTVAPDLIVQTGGELVKDGTGTLTISNTASIGIGGEVTLLGGLFELTDVTNLSGKVFTGGFLQLEGGDLKLPDDVEVFDSGFLHLEGTSEVFNPLSSNGLAGLHTINDGATLELSGLALPTALINLNGILRVNDGADLQNGGGTTTLGPTGVFTGNDGGLVGNVSNGGQLKPGNSPGTLYINGNYTQTSAGKLVAELNDTTAGNYDVLDVYGPGNVTLDGIIELVPNSTYATNAIAGTITPLIEYDGARTGTVTFTNTGTALPTGRVFSVSLDDTNTEVEAKIVATPTTGNDTLVGTALADVIDALAGNDSVSGLAGNDTLRGNAGNDTLLGGDGLDKLFGGIGADSLLGGNGNDTLKGEAGNDILEGSAGNDVLTGGPGFDKLKGGAGKDILWANDGKKDKLIDCGPGRKDTAHVDKKDPKPRGCEKVMRH